MNAVHQPTNSDKVQFGAVIRKYRKKRGFTQQQLADLLGITPKSVSCIERGFSYPSPENIFKVARVLDFSLDEFVFGVSRYDPTIEIPEINEMLRQLNPQKKAAAISIMEIVCLRLKDINQ